MAALVDERRGTFEWVAGWDKLAPLLTPEALGLPRTARVADVGCGNSTLPLHLGSLYESVLGLDREQHTAETMRTQHGSEHRRVAWATCDVCDADSLASACPQGLADLVVDKGMLDCAIVEHDAARLLCNVRSWLLSPRGVYVVVSFRKPELLVPVLSCPELGWEVRHTALRLPGVEQQASVCVMRRAEAAAGGRPPDEAVVGRHIGAVVDRWYREESPLLTAEREQQLRAGWEAALARLSLLASAAMPEGHLPLREAWELMLTCEERGELPADEFAADVGEFLGRAGAAAAPGAATLGLAQALAYLQEQA